MASGARRSDNRRLGNPRTEEERKVRHERLHPNTKVPPRGTGRK